MAVWTIIGIILVFALIISVGLLSGRKVKNTGDFLTGGGEAGSWFVCGAIMGSLVSSQATIGTAQLAFHYGFAAWWFTLGAGIGCLLLGLGYVRAFRNSGCITELQIISQEYGTPIGSLSSILCSLGILLSVLAQVVACAGLITVLFPMIPYPLAALLSITVMCFYVIFGGAWGAGMGGIVKLVLLYTSSVVGMAYVFWGNNGAAGIVDGLNHLMSGTALGAAQQAEGLSALLNSKDIEQRFFNLVARGTLKDIGSGLSLLLGVLSTQTYAQAIWSAKTDQNAKQGALLSALLIPPLGIAGIYIGLFMRANYLTQAEVDILLETGVAVPELPVLSNTIQVFPAFVLDHLPALPAGIILGTLLITVVGGGAGLSLGMATILVKDIYKRIIVRSDTVQKELLITRCTIGGILLITAAAAIIVPNKTINDLGFLSMGLRGAVVFVPLNCALWFKGRIDSRFVLASILFSPLAVILGKLISFPFDPLFLGIIVSVLCCTVGAAVHRQQHRSATNPLRE